MINLNIEKTILITMCELKIIFKGKTIMNDVIRIKADGDLVSLYGMLGEEKTVSGRIKDVNLTKQEAIIDS
jgi:predicted RNA-binding protein